MLYPLSYGGYATWERVPVKEPLPDTRRYRGLCDGPRYPDPAVVLAVGGRRPLAPAQKARSR